MADARRSDAPFGARLLAFALTTSALLSLATAWLQRRVLAALDAPGTDWSERDKLFASLETLGRGEVACELLLAGLLLLGALRFGRGLGDALTRNLSLGAGILLALDALRVVAFNLDLAWGGGHPERMQLWMISGLLVRLGGLGLLTAAVARGDTHLARRPWWALAAAGLLLCYPLALWLGRAEGVARGGNLIDWLPVILAAATLVIAAAAVRLAGRIDTGPIAGAWVRAAAGLERYRDATALRVLILVCAAVFVMMARFSGFSPLVTLGGLCLLGLLGPVIGLFQIAGLVRVADAPVARVRLGLALPLLGLGVAAECAALIPIASFAWSGGRDTDGLRHLDPAGLGLDTQALGLVATLLLLLAFRGLARARAVASAAARCTTMLVVMLALVALVLAAWWLLPELRLDRDVAMLMVFGTGLGLLVAAIWLVVVYLRMLKELADAMALAPARAAPLTAGAP